MFNAGTRTPWPAGRWVALVRWAAGCIFMIFGVNKFSGHAAELASFRRYPLPAPDVFVHLAGVIETGGGVLLIMGLLTRLAAVVLAADMLGAIVVFGLAHGELISLTLAPLSLVAMIGLIRLVPTPGRLTAGSSARRPAGTVGTPDIPQSRPPRSHPCKEN